MVDHKKIVCNFCDFLHIKGGFDLFKLIEFLIEVRVIETKKLSTGLSCINKHVVVRPSMAGIIRV